MDVTGLLNLVHCYLEYYFLVVMVELGETCWQHMDFTDKIQDEVHRKNLELVMRPVVLNYV
jgi:hypothetical protein